MAEITVRGDGVATSEPDEAEMSLRVSASRPTAPEALSEVAERSARLASALDDLGVPPDDRGTSGLGVHEHYEYDERGRQQHRGFVAETSLEVRLESADAVAAVMRAAVERAGAQVQGPRWRLATDNPTRLEACRLAAVEARRKAEAYAGALGLRLGVVVRATEPRLDLGPVPHTTFAPLDAAPAEIDVETPRLHVAASLDVTFALEPA